MFHASSVNDVVEGLTSIVSDSIDRGDRDGYFAAMYRQVTVEVQTGIREGDFDDGPRMSRFNALFGNRYFDAYYAWHNNNTGPDCWREAFSLANSSDSIVVQHLILGVNAHINLDLAVAAAETVQFDPEALSDLKHDYFLINGILDRVFDKIQEIVIDVSPYYWLLDTFAGRTADSFLDFNIRKARVEAWRNAMLLCYQETERERIIKQMDCHAALIAKLVARPSGLARASIDLISFSENSDISSVITSLDNAMLS